MFLKITLFVIVSFNVYSSDTVDSVKSFKKWLKKNENFFLSCTPSLKGESFHLCDKTVISKEEISSLFKMDPLKIINYLRRKKINVEVYCHPSDSNNQNTFEKICTKNVKRPSFKKNHYLQGKFLGVENTILIHSHALKGSLIHEYIHYLQYKNKNKVFGKRYKFERSNIEKRLLKEMDSIIAKVKNIEKNSQRQKELIPYVKRATALSKEIQEFSYWQDLIDERGIFRLFLDYSQEIGVSVDDINLAKKNMGFICGRKELQDVLKDRECIRIERAEGSYLKFIHEVMKEVRGNIDDKNLKRFLSKSFVKKNNLEMNVKMLTDYIFKTWKITADATYLSRSQKDNILPDSVLEKRKGHCVGLSMLFLMLAEKIGLDAYLVRIPGHVFVRACEKKRCLNVEMLKNGNVVSEEYYFRTIGITKKEIDGSYYFKSIIDKKNIKSSLYLSLGYIAYSYKQYSLAELFYKKSIDADRRFVEGYSNLAGVYSITNNKLRSNIYLNTALKINPNHIQTLVNKSINLWNDKKEKEAFDLLKKAQKINPNKPMVYFTRSLFLKAKKNRVKEFINLKAGLLLENKNCNMFQRFLDLLKLDNKKSKLPMESVDFIREAGQKYCL